MDGFNLQNFILTMAILVIAITIHEFAHAITADRLGDPTPRSQGRISLFPTDHLDPLGTMMMAISSFFGFGIGWGKPVMTNPGNFRNPRQDSAIVAVAGPISNVLQAIAFALIIRAMGGVDPTTSVGFFLTIGVIVNLSLAFFNLIPIAPLDGHWIMTAILPYEQAMAYRDWMLRYGPLLFLGLIFFGRPILQMIVGQPTFFFARLLLTGL